MMTAPHDAKREARLLREAHHPNVMPLTETFNLDGGRFVMVFPFVRYEFEHLLRRDMVTASQIKSILRDMFLALSHLHALGIIHRDIKPSNILMNSPNGPAYLADFGISWKEGDAGSEAPSEKITDVGTTCYRPPEILFGHKAYGTALDIWAAGCVVAEAIAVGHRQLFDAGPIGSDLSLIFSIFKIMGTPDEERWPVSSSPTIQLQREALTMSRKSPSCRIGERLNFTIFPRKLGKISYPLHLPMGAIWSLVCCATRAVLDLLL